MVRSLSYILLLLAGGAHGPLAREVPASAQQAGAALGEASPLFVPPRAIPSDVMTHWPAYPHEARRLGQQASFWSRRGYRARACRRTSASR